MSGGCIFLLCKVRSNERSEQIIDSADRAVLFPLGHGRIMSERDHDITPSSPHRSAETVIQPACQHSSIPDFPWTIGDVVHEREDDTPDPAIIVNTPDVSAEEWDIPRFGTTLAEANPDYPPDASVITVVFEETRENRISYATLAERSVQYYSFPAPRLESVEPPEATDPNGETDDEATSPSTTDEDETEPSTATAGDTDTAPSPSTEESSPEPSAAMRALQQRLNDGGGG